ncbi:MAG: ABC transporter permease subunit [Sedimentisphaerales bacterium]|nr:ABC transporter permease subunit [Sedimentisphaerales bacterium]
MTFTETLTNILRFLEPTWLTGPLLDKELRIASRRRRTYLIRTGYLVGLIIFIAIAWGSASLGGSSAFLVSRMPYIGRQVTCFIVWFQFCTAQLIIIAMLCSSLSDEITKRTLDVLLSTPVTSLQLVTGKFLSRCFQVMILIALSLPVLAIIRVFGGVSWHFVIASLAVTLAAMVFAGSLALLGSVFFHRAHRCIIAVVGMLLVLYIVPPLLLSPMLGLPGPITTALTFFTERTNPFLMLEELTASEFWVDPTGVNINWPGLCRTLGLVSLGGLLVAVIAVRFLVRGSLAGLNPKNWFLGPRTRLGELTGNRGVQPVRGQAICWKDMRHTLWRRGRPGQLILLILVLVVAAVYSWGFASNWIIQSGFHALLFSILGFICLLRVGIAAAAGVSGEKEARTLESLLTTPLEDRTIIWGKALAAFLRSGIFTAWLLIHLVIFTIMGFVHPIALVYGVLSLAGNLVLVIGIGLYFSARLKTTIAALVASFISAMVLLFFCCGSMSNPVTVTSLIQATASRHMPMFGFGFIFVMMFIGPVIHGIIGLIFYHRAIANLRKRL